MNAYYTLVLFKTVPAFTNQWNECPVGWTSMTRGTFPTEQAACERAREILPHGAPFAIRYIEPMEF